MANIIKIETLNIDELNVYTHLTEAQLRRKIEPQMGIFIAETEKVIRVALQAGYTPISILMDERHIEGLGKSLLELAGDIPVYAADRDTLSQITGYTVTRGFLCAMKRPSPLSAEQLCQNGHRIAVLEGIVDATNIGAIFRSAAALHMDAILLTSTCCDPLNRRAMRVSMGTVCQIPWARFGDGMWPQKGLDLLHQYEYKTAAMALSSDAINVQDPRLKKENKLAIIMGAEGDGLSPTTIAGCDYTVCIPMSHGVDSLNVAAASAVAFWEMRRNFLK